MTDLDTAARTSTPVSWWPEPGSPQDGEWSRETLRVVEHVARRSGRVLYGDRVAARWLADDLRSFLVLEAMDIRSWWVPPPPEEMRADMLTTWVRHLNVLLPRHAEWHFSRMVRIGLSPRDARVAVYRADSTDRPLGDGDGDGSPDEATVGTLGTPVWPVGEPTDPEAHFIAREALAAVVGSRQVWDWGQTLALLDEAAPEPGAGQCQVWGCSRQPAWSRATGLCGPHYAQDRAERAPRCEVRGCDGPGIARRMCNKHYKRARKRQAVEVPA